MKKIIYFPFILILLFNSNANAQCETNYQGCVINFSPLEVNFEGNPSGSTTGINSYTWDFGDGQTGTGQNITHTYSAQGTYQICLMIATNVGCIDTTCIGLYFIQPAPNLTGYLWP
ncbi:MAG TPA: PKD domain-containing protein, partial [Bacteroidia bacterium]|nr:PKD domain-containing protein [Bacteroidia bacterium]